MTYAMCIFRRLRCQKDSGNFPFASENFPFASIACTGPSLACPCPAAARQKTIIIARPLPILSVSLTSSRQPIIDIRENRGLHGKGQVRFHIKKTKGFDNERKTISKNKQQPFTALAHRVVEYRTVVHQEIGVKVGATRIERDQTRSIDDDFEHFVA